MTVAAGVITSLGGLLILLGALSQARQQYCDYKGQIRAKAEGTVWRPPIVETSTGKPPRFLSVRNVSVGSLYGWGLILIGSALVFVGSILSTIAGVSHPRQDQGALYGDHSYACCNETMTGQPIRHSGEDVKLHWYALPPARTTDPTAHRVDLKLTLTGPFTTVTELRSAVSLKGESAGTRTVRADRCYDRPER